MKVKDYIKSIMQLTNSLIEINLSIEQSYPSFSGNTIYINGDFDQSVALRNLDYQEIYSTIHDQKNFNIKFIDGGLIQLMYCFERESLIKHRLCFFPSPNLLAYDANFELYEMDEIYGDMILKSILPIPMRFDYESDHSKYIDIIHPYSHLTLGQHKGCRIPINSPITPYSFISFIVRNFYSKFYTLFVEKYNGNKNCVLNPSISDNEKRVLHLNII